MTWMRKSTAMMAPRDMRLKKLHRVIDEQSPVRIERDSLTFLAKRKLQEYHVLLNRRQMLREWHTTQHMFHSEIGAQSVLQVADEDDSGYSTEIPDGLHVHSNGGREQNSTMHHICGNAQWSGDASERVGSVEEHPRNGNQRGRGQGFNRPDKKRLFPTLSKGS